VKVTTGEGTCHAHSEADGNGEEAEQNQVDRVLLVVVVEWAQHCTAKRKNIFSNVYIIDTSIYTSNQIPILGNT